jgi:hypothetical protein
MFSGEPVAGATTVVACIALALGEPAGASADVMGTMDGAALKLVASTAPASSPGLKAVVTVTGTVAAVTVLPASASKAPALVTILLNV